MSINPKPYSTRCLRTVWAVLGMGLLVAYAVSPALAEDDDDDGLTFEQRIITNILGGISGQAGSGIEYRERSPLVVPPSRDLPPPDSASALDRSPSWPKDPEVRRKAAVKKKRQERGVNSTVRATELWQDPGRPLLPSELDSPGSSARGTGRVTSAGQSVNDVDAGKPLPPSKLGYTGGLFGSIFKKSGGEESAAFDGEPPRSNLTDPPAGYQTPSPGQPYGLRADKGKWYKIPNFFDRGTQPN